MALSENSQILPSISSEDFLPPVNPWTVITGLILVLSVCASLALSSFIKYNVTVRTAATIRPAGEIKLVQPEIEGTVTDILVKENQKIKKGDAIARLDDRQLLIKKSQLQGDIQQNQLQLNEIDGQISNVDSQIAAETTVVQRTVAAAKADLLRTIKEQQDKQSTTESEVLAASYNVEKSKADLEKAKAELVFAQQKLRKYQPLCAEGAVAREQCDQIQLNIEQASAIVDNQQKSVNIAQARVDATKVGLSPNDAVIDIAKERIRQEAARGESAIAELHQKKQVLTQQRIAMLNQIKQRHKDIMQLDTQMQSTVIRATSNGTIFKLNLLNSGQVVKASEPVAEIVPDNAPVVIKTLIPSTEIAKVRENQNLGQKVQLRVEACPYPDFGTLNGKIVAISPDAIAPTTNNLNGTATAARFYEATIQPETTTFGDQKRKCHIVPGMDAQADIIAQEETALQFILRRARITTNL